MTPPSHFETLATLARGETILVCVGLATAPVYGLLTGRINLMGLLRHKGPGAGISPGRVQGLMVTLGLAGMMLMQALEAATGPSTGPHQLSLGIEGSELVMALGGSHALYLFDKYRTARTAAEMARLDGG